MQDESIKAGDPYQYSALIEVAYELLSLLKDPANGPHVVHLASSLQEVSRPLFNKVFVDLFFEVQEIADLAKNESSEEYRVRNIQSLRSWLRDLSDESVVNPGITADDKTALDKHSLPILAKMVNDPEYSPKFFIELTHELDNLVNSGKLSPLAASQEIHHTLDRPQIMAAKELQHAVEKAYELEQPYKFRRYDPMKQWQMFVEAVEATRR